MKDELFLNNKVVTGLINSIESNGADLVFDETPLTIQSKAIGTDCMMKLANDSNTMIDLTKDYRTFVCNALVPSMRKIQKSFNDNAKGVSLSLSMNKKTSNKSNNNKSKKIKKKTDEFVDFLYQNGITVTKRETNDGYFIIEQPISEIMVDAGIDKSEMDLTAYDDWYIAGLINSDGTIVYSMIKVREPMDEQGSGTAVVFKSLDINALQTVIEDSHNGRRLSKSELDIAKSEIDSVVYSVNDYESYDKNLVNYFKEAKSEGSYLIADFIVDNVAQNKEFEDGKYKLPYEYDEFCSFSQSVLDELAKDNIYDKSSNTITIKNPGSLSENEKKALLLITTDDPDKYAFAAENQFHAAWYDAYKDMDSVFWNGIANVNIANYIEKHCIASDTGVGESDSYFSDTYEKWFKDEDGVYYEAQYNAHSK